MTTRIITSCAALAATLVIAGSVALADADVPPRAASGQTLDIPEKQLDQGEVFHVLPALGTQFVLRNDADLLLSVAVCNHVVGYFVAPFDLEAARTPLLAGAFRVPVPALRVGAAAADQRLLGSTGLDADSYPEITFILTDTRDVQREEGADGRYACKLSLLGQLTIKDQVVDIEIPAEVRRVPFTWQMQTLTMGDLLVVRGSWELPTDKCGLSTDSADFIGPTTAFDIAFGCSTVPPDASLDPRVSRETLYAQQQFLTRLRDFDDPADAYAYGRELLSKFRDDAFALTQLAMLVLTEDDIERRDCAFVEQALKRANELTSGQDANTLNALARLSYQRGDLAGAVAHAQEAVEHLENLAPYEAFPIRQALQQYEAEQSALTPKPAAESAAADHTADQPEPSAEE